jgi:hypothetical protein
MDGSTGIPSKRFLWRGCKTPHRVADTLTSAGSWKCVKAAAPPDSAAAITSSSKEAGTFSRSYTAITNANRLKEYLQEIQRMKWMKILFDEIDLL